MVARDEYRTSLKGLSRDQRLCFLYLEELINSKQPVIQSLVSDKPNLTPINIKLDSLQNQMNGLKLKVEKTEDFISKYDDTKKYLENIEKQATALIEEAHKAMKKNWDNMSISDHRKIREDGFPDPRTY
jgi:hypothetical protein